MSLEAFAKNYPRTVECDGKSVEVRIMTPEDGDAILAFARGLPEEDLLFLRQDITKSKTVDSWVNKVEEGVSTTLLAFHDDQLIGYASVESNRAHWTRRVGEIRVNVGPEFRSKGLGRILTAQVFDLAHQLGLSKLVANMTADQSGAQAAFKRLGFVAEALLADFVEDRAGNTRDMVIMSYDVDGFTGQMDEPLRL